MAPSDDDSPGELTGLYPSIFLGQHDSKREIPVTEAQQQHLQDLGFSYVTSPITNSKFHARVLELARHHLDALDTATGDQKPPDTIQTPTIPIPVVPSITPFDTSLFPGVRDWGGIAYASPWIDVGSLNAAISNISQQVLNLECSYASFCGARTVVVPGPRQDALPNGMGKDSLIKYSRAIKELLSICPRLAIVVHMPMYREPDLEEQVSALTEDLREPDKSPAPQVRAGVDLFSAWETWDLIRSMCSYNVRLTVGVRMPDRLPVPQLQDRWFAEPVTFFSMTKKVFKTNSRKLPCLGRDHRWLIHNLVKLKNAPSFMLCDIGPDMNRGVASGSGQPVPTEEDFPPLSEDQSETLVQPSTRAPPDPVIDYIRYMRWVESQQTHQSELEFSTLTGFQDWLQSPLQPLSDNLESSTYEVFESDPVKYDQYEAAIEAALIDWRQQGKPKSSEKGVVIAVAGSGRGPLVQRALTAASSAEVDVVVWAIEKNPNAYVYLLNRNCTEWQEKVHVVKTDMRTWPGPRVSKSGEELRYGKVDILVSELLGSFGDNELSPECLDGIQHVLAPHGISIPRSYTAHLSPISTPKIHSDLLLRLNGDPKAFDTPWVVRLYQADFSAMKNVPGHHRFQEAWEFVHPLPKATWEGLTARRSYGLISGGGGSMEGAVGANEHNARYSHLTFVCPHRGVIHGLAGYFESTLYESGEAKVEISTHPDRIDKKSPGMISWFPIFFPLRNPLYYPDDSEVEVSMWRQTDDTKVWYEWIVEVYTWTSADRRIKVASSSLCSSRNMACLM